MRTEKGNDTLVTLREDTGSTPLIFVHPIGGTLFTYKALAARLTTHNPIYGIQDHFLDDKFRRYESLSEQAEYYIRTIFEKLNIDTMVLAGHSSGGSLAFEMARQCVNYGVKVKQVLMFDTWVKPPFDHNFKLYFQKIILRQVDKLEATNYISNERVKSQWLELLWQRMDLLFSYIPEPVPISAVLFAASETVAEYTVNEGVNYDWGKFVKELTIVPVAGNHETMLDIQNIEQLSNKVNEYLYR